MPKKKGYKKKWTKAPYTPIGNYYYNNIDNNLYLKKGKKFIKAKIDPYFHGVSK